MIKISAALAVLALASPAVPSLPGGATGDGGYEFAVIADTSYRPPQEEEFMRLRKEMNEEDLAFTLHLGDVIGRGPCSDERLIAVRDSFDEFEDPLVYTPGDNEWTDCHRTQEDPLERLTALRRIFFADDRSQGERKLTVTRQAGYPENARWALGPVTFATIHVVGSQDGFGRAPDGDGEQQARRQAVVGWMDETVRAAADAGHHGVVLA
ncbi:MAG: metallophosphoesterase, partial [Acidimicrobiia bacterium]